VKHTFLADSFEHWLAVQELGRRTRRLYSVKVRRFLDYTDNQYNVNLMSTTARQLDQILEQYSCALIHEGVSNATVNSHLTAISCFFRYLLIAAPKIKRFKAETRESKWLTDGQHARYLDAISQCSQARDRVISRLILRHGLRLRDCARLHISDVTANEIVMDFTTPPRCIFLDESTAEDMQAWLANRKTIADPSETALFLTKKGNPPCTATIDFALRRIGISCGLDVCARVLRNTYLQRQQLIFPAEVSAITPLTGLSQMQQTLNFSG
jgi:site-specific recombinase XerC